MNAATSRHGIFLTGLSSSPVIRPTAIALAVAACFSGAALANPTNPTVVHGTATFQQAGNILNISNSHNAIIHWGSFSINAGELTRFIQPSALSAVLNRVTGQDPSAILGALESNGRVFLINPNGIVFGAGAQINVAGLVASTLNLSNDDFLNNRLRFTDGALGGSVVNQGSLTGGSVYLVGKAVTNDGLITSPNGEVVLAAGNSVELVNPGTPNLRVEIVAPDNEARNLGTISAEAGRIGIYAGLIKQGGTLNADSAVSEGGRIVLKSTRKTTLDAGSVTSARGVDGGEIIVLSDMQSGTTEVAGTLDVSAVASGMPGKGGFIETSAANVQIADSAVFKRRGSGGGNAGTWLIDPYDFTIAASGGNITAGALVSALSEGSVVISTAAYGGVSNYYGGSPFPTANGDIFVNQAVSWNNGNSLTLTAERHLEVNQAITNSGTGSINLNAGWDGISSPSSPTLTSGVGDIKVNANLSSKGSIYLKAGRDITLTGVTLSAGGSGGVIGPVARLESTGGSILATNSTVTAAGPDGGEGYAYLYANSGSINTSSSTVSATGADSTVYFSAGSNITLGLASAANRVDIRSSGGAIIDGNSGLNASATTIYLKGSNGGVGSIANPIETQGTYLDVYSSYGGVGIAHTGNLQLRNLSNSSGTGVAIGATGTLTVEGAEGSISLPSDLSLVANGNLNVYHSVTAAAKLRLEAGGNITVGKSSAYNGGRTARGNTETLVIAGGSLSVVAGENDGYFPSTLGSSSSLTKITTGGNLLVEKSTIQGSPDIELKVGGVININGTSGYGGTISAGSVNTILLTFPNLTSGGYSVNGVAGQIYDQATGSGFLASGDPAVLGQSLKVTYGTGIMPPTDTLIVAMGESTKPPDPEKDKDVFDDVKKDKKKETPVCR